MLRGKEVLTQFVKDCFKKYSTNDIYFVGFGNIYRGDDGFGIRVIEKLKEAGIKKCFNENDGIENILLKIIEKEKNKLIIFFDVSNFSKNSGDIIILSQDRIKHPKTLSHKIPLKLYMNLLKKNNNLSYLIAVQPKNLNDTLENPQLSRAVENTMEIIVENIKKVLF